MAEDVTLKAGRELDTRIAQAVFGWATPVYITDECLDPNRPIFGWKEQPWEHGKCPICGDDEYCEHGTWSCGQHTYYPAFPFSTDIAAAWQVVEKMRERAVFIEIAPTEYGYRIFAWWNNDKLVHAREAKIVSADMVPAAICRCALKALEATQ